MDTGPSVGVSASMTAMNPATVLRLVRMGIVRPEEISLSNCNETVSPLPSAGDDTPTTWPITLLPSRIFPSVARGTSCMILAVIIWPGRLFDDERDSFSRMGNMVPRGMSAVPVVLSCARAPGKVSSTASIAVLAIKPETTLTRRNFSCFTIFSLTCLSTFSEDGVFSRQMYRQGRLRRLERHNWNMQQGCQSY